MLKGLCPACLQPFRDGDECKEVGNNTLTIVLGKKSGQMVAVPLNDPATSVIVHRHCTVLYDDPKTNEEYQEEVLEMRLPGLRRDWEIEELDRIREEAYDQANDDLKRICAACKEEIEIMGDDEEEYRPPLPWGVTS